MSRAKMLMIVLAAAALGVGAAFLAGEWPAKAWASMMVSTAAVVPPSAKPAPASNPAPMRNLLRIDGDRSEMRVDGQDTGLHADKDGVSLRTLFGKFDLRW